MSDPRFVHLRLHSEFSISDGIVRLDEAVARAAADGMPALALTDLGNLFGLIKFYKAARAAGVKPLIGCDIWLTNRAERDKPHRLLLLVRNHGGYLSLCQLLSRAWLENQHRGRAEVDPDWLSTEACDGLIALSGAADGDVGVALLQDRDELAAQLSASWSQRFPGRYYLELQRHGAAHCEPHVRKALALATRCGLPVVATHPVQFLRPEEFTAHEARVCISGGHVLSDQRRPRLFTEQSFFTSQQQMAELFADLPEALANSVEIAKRCSLVLELGKNRLPDFPTPEGQSLEQFLMAEAEAGLARRMLLLYPEAEQRQAQLPRYAERLKFEVGTIVQMGFPGYFLIVADFINWAKRNGVPVGPGRGSGAGSLVAYSLGITDLDPLRYDLLFERFLNPERVSMPDFDIDFCQDGRDRVIEYVRDKYGRDSVSQIVTFGTMAAKAVVRDVGRVMEWSYGRTDELAKMIPFQPGKLITLAAAREMEPLLAERERDDEETRELLALAGQLEGMTRNVGMHAGGVLIVPGKLTDFCPLYAAQGSDSVVSQLDKDDVEAIGLVKFDFLGLTTLTILDWTLRYLRDMGQPEIVLETLPLDDARAYAVFASANTGAVFQFESRGMRDLLKRARPDRFEDIIALVALYRPGPMDLIPDFIDRKHGRQQVSYLDPRLESILGQTYGVMVYQEQVMQIAQVIGGYSLGAADLLRRAMGKKKPEEMAQQRSSFVEGACKGGVSEVVADDLFNLMEMFAGYGFNKSHAAAYALVAYQTAYLKAHHPAAFMAANLSAVMDDTDKAHGLVEDSRSNGLKLLGPDINLGSYRFVPVDEKTIRYGLGAIKGTGESAIAEIVAAREGRPAREGGEPRSAGAFRDLFDLCRRVDRRIVNRRVIEALVRAGAFDRINPDRASQLASVGIAMEAADQAERDAGQASLFGGADEADQHAPALLTPPSWDDARKLAEEKLALGFYFSGHPFAAYRKEVSAFIRGSLAELAPRQEASLIAGFIVATRMQQTRNGRMAVIVLDDGTAVIEVTAFAELYEANRELLREDRPVVIQGKISRDEYSGGGLRVRAEKIFDLCTARGRFARQMRLAMNGEASRSPGQAAARLKTLLAPYRNGPCPVAIQYINDNASVELKLGEDWRVTLDDRLLTQLNDWLRPENVQIQY
jgi:DNA polymerase-3 subunit alpha